MEMALQDLFYKQLYFSLFNLQSPYNPNLIFTSLLLFGQINKTMKIPNNDKKTNARRLLKYKPRKGEQSRQWKIQGIVNDRIILKPAKQRKSQLTTFGSKPVLNYIEQKEYEIAWQQQCQKGIWPNTWQPQQNIPDFTRLDYLLRKRSQLRISKKKSREMRIRIKESFKQHHLFSTKKMNVKSETKIGFEEKRENVKKTMDKDSQQQQKPQKMQDYKEWFMSYNFDPEDYEKLIYRFLNGIKNQDSQKMEIIGENDLVKIPYDEMHEFPFTFADEKNQEPNHQAEEAGISLAKTEDQQQHSTRPINHALSSGPSTMLIKDIHYIGDDGEVDYFMLILFDNTQAYISEEDLVKYFPFVYEKFLMEKIDGRIEECKSSLLGLNHQLNFMHQNCIKNLGEKISFNKEDFDMSGRVQNIFNLKNDNTFFADADYVFGDPKKETQYSSPKTIELNIHNYFYFLKEISHQAEIIQPQMLNEANDQSKQNILFQATRCKELFQKYDVGRIKEEMEYEKKQLQQKPKQNNIQAPKAKLQIKNEKSTKTQGKIQLKLLQQMQKNKHLKINTEEKQIFQILNVLEKVPKRQDDFYDSDDEEN